MCDGFLVWSIPIVEDGPASVSIIRTSASRSRARRAVMCGPCPMTASDALHLPILTPYNLNAATKGTLIQSTDIANLVLLFLHSGPGLPVVFLNNHLSHGTQQNVRRSVVGTAWREPVQKPRYPAQTMADGSAEDCAGYDRPLASDLGCRETSKGPLSCCDPLILVFCLLSGPALSETSVLTIGQDRYEAGANLRFDGPTGAGPVHGWQSRGRGSARFGVRAYWPVGA